MFGFYGISTIVGYLMPNPLYTYCRIYRTARQTTKSSSIYKNIIFFLRRRRLCEVGIQSERVHAYLSSMENTQLCSSSQWISPFAGEISGSLLFAWETSGSLPFAWAISRSLPSVQNYRRYIVFSSPMLKYCYVLTFDPAPKKMLFQGDAPEGSDTFQWQLGEEIAWAEIGWWNGTR